MALSVVIVEDQADLQSEIRLLVEQQSGFAVVGSCSKVKEAKRLIDQTKPDLLLLDIHLPDGTGFDVLDEGTNDFKVIFLTAFQNHAIKAIKYGALDYLLKPINELEFAQALAKVSQFYPPKSEQLAVASKYHKDGIRNRLVLRTQDHLQIIEIDQIIYCHSDSGYTSFFLNDGSKIVASKIIKDYEDILTEPYFVRPHQSYLVHFKYVNKYRKDGLLILKNGTEIPVSTRRKEAILEYFNEM